MASPDYTEALRSQKRRELLRSAGPLGIGLLSAAAVSVANIVLGPWETVSSDVVAQIIPVLMVAVAIEGGGRFLAPLPRKAEPLSRVAYWLILAAFSALLFTAEFLAIVEPSSWCSGYVAGIQIAAMMAGLATVVLGVGFTTIGASLPMHTKVVRAEGDTLIFELGVSNEFRAREIIPLLNLLVPKNVEVTEVSRSLTDIDGSPLLPTSEDIPGFSNTEWVYLTREFGISAGDSRVCYFQLTRTSGYAGQDVPVVARLDSQEVVASRAQIVETFRW